MSANDTLTTGSTDNNEVADKPVDSCTADSQNFNIVSINDNTVTDISDCVSTMDISNSSSRSPDIVDTLPVAITPDGASTLETQPTSGSASTITTASVTSVGDVSPSAADIGKSNIASNNNLLNSSPKQLDRDMAEPAERQPDSRENDVKGSLEDKPESLQRSISAGRDSVGDRQASERRWVGSVDEPEFEFDDMDMDLAVSPGSRPSCSTEDGGQVCDGQVGDEEEVPVDEEFEEDFEDQLGAASQGDENDPELAYRDIAKFSIVQVAGDDAFGRKVIVFSACNLPPREELDQMKLLGFLRHTLDKYVENDYTLVYFHHGLDRKNKPSFSWLRQAYYEFDRKYKKNLKALYVVHPTKFIKIMWNIFRPFISVKFGSKLMYLNYLHELAQHLQLDQIIVPLAVRNYDAELLARNKPRPVPISIIHAPIPTQQFGVELEFIKRNNGGEIIPHVIQQCVRYLRENGLETEGIFRRCASTKVLKEVQKAFNEGSPVDFAKLNDIHIPAAILKSFLRQLPEPVLTYELYDHIIHVQSMEADERLAEMRRILTEELPTDNYCLLKYVVHFLTEVASKSDVNRMTAENLAIVFGPNLLWSKNEASLTLMGYVQTCALLLITNYTDLFVK